MRHGLFERRPSRRGVLAAGGGAVLLAAGGAGVPWLRRQLAAPLAFEPVAGAPGFRRLSGGAVSGGSPALIGIGADARLSGEVARRVRAAPCRALFGEAPAVTATVPIAYFSDYRCPVCRELEPRLADFVADAEGAVRVTRHQLPILSPSSVTAARAALAARAQGAYTTFNRRLLRTSFRPTDGYLRALAKGLGLDPDKLLRDMHGPAVTRQLAVSRALADRFGLSGTPALVVGRTVVVGDIGRGALDRLVAVERREGMSAACGPGANRESAG